MDRPKFDLTDAEEVTFPIYCKAHHFVWFATAFIAGSKKFFKDCACPICHYELTKRGART